MRRRAFRQLGLALALGAIPTGAEASSVAVSVGRGSTETSANSPVGTFENSTLSGILDLSKALSLNLSVTGTHDNQVGPAPGTRFGSSGDNILNLAAGLDWSPNNHISLGLDGSFSPKTQSSYDTTVTVQSGGRSAGRSAGTLTEDGRLTSDSGTYGFAFNAGYDTAGESDFESALSAEAALTHISSLQALTNLVSGGGAIEDLGRLRGRCLASRAAVGCQRLLPLLQAQAEAAEIDELALGGSYTATLFSRTDLTGAGTYFFYPGKDPTEAGFFSVALVGRTSNARGRAASGPRGRGRESLETISFGGGLPLFPLSYKASLGVSQELGPVNIAVTGGYGSYYHASGNSKTLGARVAYKLTKQWKATATFTRTRDTDETGTVTSTSLLTLGLRRSF